MIIAPIVEQISAPIVEPIVVTVSAPIVEPIVETISTPIVETISAPIVAPIVAAIVEPISSPVIEQIVSPIVEEKIENQNVTLFINDVVEEIQEISLENTEEKVPIIVQDEPIKPQLTKVSQTVHTTINVKEGRKILNNLKIHPDSGIYSEDIIKILIAYCDRCAQDQIALALNYMTHNKRIEFLLELINLRYISDKDEILCGSKLNTIFMKLK
jgi:hypothetical protein